MGDREIAVAPPIRVAELRADQVDESVSYYENEVNILIAVVTRKSSLTERCYLDFQGVIMFFDDLREICDVEVMVPRKKWRIGDIPCDVSQAELRRVVFLDPLRRIVDQRLVFASNAANDTLWIGVEGSTNGRCLRVGTQMFVVVDGAGLFCGICITGIQDDYRCRKRKQWMETCSARSLFQTPR